MSLVTAVLLNSLNDFQVADQQSQTHLTSSIIFYVLPPKNVIPFSFSTVKSRKWEATWLAKGPVAHILKPLFFSIGAIISNCPSLLHWRFYLLSFVCLFVCFFTAEGLGWISWGSSIGLMLKLRNSIFLAQILLNEFMLTKLSGD